MRTCGACGTGDQSDNARFCFSCGQTLDADPTCATCGAELRPGARFCADCGTPTGAAPPAGVAAPAAPDATTPRGTARKITSVLFGDLVGFTTISESRDAEEVRELLSAYFEECRAIVARYGGELEKFIGDAVMAVWGLPVTREDDAERAVRAGLELVEAVQALGGRINVPGLDMRVGITTAEVAVNLGATGQGMVAGDPVNTAARIQSTAEPGQVWVDETTRNFAATSIAFDDAGSHAMKGKAEPVPLWKVRAVVAGSGGDRRDDGLEAELVGRDGELRLVKEFFHRVQETLRPGMLVVDGEAGVGKSRLSWEFEKYVDGFDASVLWHRGRCLSYGEGVAYYALAEAVRGRLAVFAGEGPEDAGQVLHRGLAASVPDAAERDWLQPRLAVLLGLDRGGASYPREDLFVAWTTFFKYVSRWQSDAQQPVVLVIDDAQHVDDGLLAFLEHLLSAADYPVFVLMLARPELLSEHQDLIGNRRVTVVHLEPLTTAEMTDLLDSLVHGVPDAIRAELVDRAEGIPLYAIETVRALADQNLVEARGGRFVLTDPDTVDLSALTAPTSLQALIAARLDTLPAAERVIVDRASVLGQVFTAEGIAALCEDVSDLDGAITGLVRRDVLRRDTDRLSADFGSYRFVQGAVRQVAYGMLSRRDRKATHLRVARAFEIELAARADAYELAPIIAQHYLDAIDAVLADPDVPELTQLASDHLERAADRASALGAPREAAGHLEKALSRCAADRRLSIQSRLARELRVAGEHDRAIEHGLEAVKGLEAAGDLVSAAAPAEDVVRAMVYSEGDLERAATFATDLLARIPDEPETLRARLTLTNAQVVVALRNGDPAEYERVTWQALKLAELIGDPREISVAWSGVANSIATDLPTTSFMMHERAAAVASEQRALRPRGLALVNLTASATFDDLDDAVRIGAEAVAAATELGDKYMRAFAESNLSFALLVAGDWEQAEALSNQPIVRQFLDVSADSLVRSIMVAQHREQLSVAETFPDDGEERDPLWMAEYEFDCALEAQLAGRADAASLALNSVRLASASTATTADFWPTWLQASQLLAEEDDRAGLAEIVTYAVPGRGAWPLAVRAQETRLRGVLGQDGSLSAEQVERHLRDALEQMRRWGSRVYEAHTCADLGVWLIRQGRADESAELLARAREVYDQLRAQRYLEVLDRRIAAAD